jgi:hypothetical protein
MKLNIVTRSLCKVSATNDSTNDVDPTSALKTGKLDSKVRKPKGSDIEWSNL